MMRSVAAAARLHDFEDVHLGDAALQQLGPPTGFYRACGYSATGPLADRHSATFERSPSNSRGHRKPAMRKRNLFKQIWKILTMLAAVVSFARVVTLFLESYSVVRQERAADQDLVDLCLSGAAQQSSKMRSACMQVQSDRAAPVLFKAILRACNTAWLEFSDAVSTPLKFFTVVVFLLSALVMPMVPMIRLASNAISVRARTRRDDDDSDDDEDDDMDKHVIMLQNGGSPYNRMGARGKLKLKFKQAMQMMHMLGASGDRDLFDRDQRAWSRMEPGVKEE